MDEPIDFSEEHKQYEIFLECFPDAVIIVREGIIIYVNAACRKMFAAASSQQLLGRKLLDLTHPISSALVEKRIQSPVSGGSDAEALLMDEKYIRLDGELIDAEVLVAPIRYQGVQAVQLMLRDITRRKNAENKMQEYARCLEIQHEIDKAILAAATPEEIAYAAIKNIFEVIPGYYANIILFDFLTREFYILSENLYGEVSSPNERCPLADFCGDIEALEREETILLDEASARPLDLSALLGGQEISLLIQIPLLAQRRLIGVLNLKVLSPEWFARPENSSTAIDIAASLAVAIHNARLIEGQSRQLHRLNALHEIDLAITRSAGIDCAVQVVIDQVIAQLHVDAVALFNLRKEDQKLVCLGAHGFRTDRILDVTLAIGEGIAGSAALERRTISFNNLAERQEKMILSPVLAGEDFIFYFSVPLFVQDQVTGVLEVFHRSVLNPGRAWMDFLQSLATQAAIAIDHASLLQGLKQANIDLTNAYDMTIEGWSKALDLRDQETEGHAQRVAVGSTALAAAMGIQGEALLNFRRGALLHDIGKMGIPDNILRKPGPLTNEEWMVMREHPTYAYRLLSPIPYLKDALDVPYYHHEKWDGSGYPLGLHGEGIPLAARIFAVVDVWDALCSDRPYRSAWSPVEAAEYLHQQSGKHFDPAVVEAFLSLYETNNPWV